MNAAHAERARFRGCLLGLAVGDAIGTTLEFKAPGSFAPIDDMVGGGPFALRPGQWTDDTSMALCLAHSLLYRQGFDAADSSRTTHAAAEALDACRVFAVQLRAALLGGDRAQLLRAPDVVLQTPALRALAVRDHAAVPAAQIRGTGYVVDALSAALWCFATTDCFADAVLRAANLGDDADTTAAICGQLAGAFYGIDGIPAAWRERVQDVAEIVALADRLHQASVAE